jgi:DNA-binding transcriptional MocR family regulator
LNSKKSTEEIEAEAKKRLIAKTPLDVPRIEPRGGIYLWARLPDGVAAAGVARHGLTRKVMFAPGPAFSAWQEARGYLRFNVARCGEPRIYEALDEAINAGLLRGASSADTAPV